MTGSVSGESISAMVCLACADKLLITNGECLADHHCKLPNCKTCARNHDNAEVCIRCEDEFVLDPVNDKCVKQITEGCLVLDESDTLTCGECLPGFYSGKGDTCVKTDVYEIGNDFDTTMGSVDKSLDRRDSDEEFAKVLGIVFCLVFGVLFQ